VGYYNDGTSDRSLTLHWDGSSWTRVASVDVGSSGSYLKGLAAESSTDVWAAGYYVRSGLYRTLIERWNGSTWTVVPSPNV
jgi:hypothetical protein